MPGEVQLRRSADRAVTATSWLSSRHSFSFGDHYDPGNTHHGVLLAHNDDTLAGAAVFDTHPHRDVEIVTWVLHGALAHRDSAGNAGVIYPGLAQRMSAGSGITHSERNASDREPVRFVQMWVQPDVAGIEPAYQQQSISDENLAGRLTTIVSGIPGHDAVVSINNRSAALHAARLNHGDEVTLPDAPYLHVFVARGRVGFSGAELGDGDAVRFVDSDGAQLTARGPAEILVWEMHAALGG